jgi:putative N-acetylmannosamine-6-phosphate epimerase
MADIVVRQRPLIVGRSCHDNTDGRTTVHPSLLLMGDWYTSNLGDAMLADRMLAEIRATFLSGYKDADDSGHMAIFIRHESEGRLHCEVRLYFTPATSVIAIAFDATRCTRPATDGLALLCGQEAAWSLWPP